MMILVSLVRSSDIKTVAHRNRFTCFFVVLRLSSAGSAAFMVGGASCFSVSVATPLSVTISPNHCYYSLSTH